MITATVPSCPNAYSSMSDDGLPNQRVRYLTGRAVRCYVIIEYGVTEHIFRVLWGEFAVVQGRSGGAGQCPVEPLCDAIFLGLESDRVFYCYSLLFIVPARLFSYVLSSAVCCQ